MNTDKTKPTPGKPEPKSEAQEYCAGYYVGYWTGMYDAVLWSSVAVLCVASAFYLGVKR